MKYSALVKEVMNTDVKTVDMDADIRTAAQLMRNNRIGSVLVMGEKRLLGILTSEDIVYKHVAQGVGKTVSDVMTRDPITITPDKTIQEAAEVMSSKRIKKLPVVEMGRTVGIITATDIVRIEPAMYDTLLERLRMRGPEFEEPAKGAPVTQCEVCGNYSDEVDEIDGVWICPDCEEMRTPR